MEWLPIVVGGTFLVLPWLVAWEAWKLGTRHVDESHKRLGVVEAHLSTIDESLRGIRNTIGGIQYDISGNRVDAAGWLPSDNFLREEVERLNGELEHERAARRELERRR